MDPKWPICVKREFFGKNHYFLAPLSLVHLKKILSEDLELWWLVIFGCKMAHWPKWEFFEKNMIHDLIHMISMYLLVPFIVQNGMKILKADDWAKIAHLTKIFFWKFLL